MIGPSWFSCCVGKKYTARHRAVRHAGPHRRASRCRASSAAPTSPCRSRAPTRRSRPTGSRTSRAPRSRRASQAKGNIPNATNLLGEQRQRAGCPRSWFVPTAKHWVDVENGNILRNMLGADPHRPADRQAGSAVGERQHRIGAQPAVTSAASALRLQHDRRRRDALGDVSAAAPFLGQGCARCGPVRADRPGGRRDRASSSAIRSTGSSSCRLQQLRPLRADPAPGRLRSGSRTTAPSCTTRSSGTRCSARSIFTAANVDADDRARDAARAAARACQRVRCASCSRSGLVLVWSMPVVVAVAGLVLDDELPERRPQLRPDGAALRRLLPARLVRDDRLAAERW